MASPKTFSLKGRALKLDTALDLNKHIEVLTSDPDIEVISFAGNTLGVEACRRLGQVLATKTQLRQADLSDIFTGRLLSEIPHALTALLTSLLECEKLETVDLNDNAFGLNTVEPLRPFLSQHVPLKHLYLNNNGLGPSAGTLVAQALEQLAAKKEEARKAGREVPDLETVVCGRNRLETGSMAAWSKAYTANNKVKTVKMVQNGIRQEGIAALLQNGLSNCKALHVLDLQDNTFTSLASTTLANVLPSWPALRELAVGDCLLSARGGISLGGALSKGSNKNIETLRLQYNEIDARGLKSLADAASSPNAIPRLRRIELNGNKFSEDDPSVERLQALLSKRKDDQASEYEGVDEDDEDSWGVDELDDMEEDEDDEDEDQQDEDELDDEEEKIVKDADKAEDEPVAQVQDKDVDDLADALGKTELK